MRSTRRFRFYGVALSALVLASVAVATVVGTSTASVGTQAGKAATSCIPPVPRALPKDPDHVLSSLNRFAQASLGGYPGTVHKSPWSSFKPKHGPPWKIGFSDNQVSLYGSGVLAGVKQERSANPGKVSKIISLVPSKPNDVGTQIQQMRSLLQQKVDIIFALLSSPTALNGVIDQAAKQGVPVISIAGQSTSKNAINLQPNTALLGYYGAAGLVNAMGGGGGGNVLMVRAIPGLSYFLRIK